ncbi:right-handed parallel beta-helix repeat-containing protein [candidate division KSB1 bacterium]|nr:right-handed parallel beta-helix repeat-containing protein [candidate division KSB1 bacterium]
MKNLAFVLSLLFSGNLLFGQNQVSIRNIRTVATFNSIGIQLQINGVNQAGTSAQIKYRPRQETRWRNGHFMAPITPALLAGSIFNLTPETEYDLRISLSNPAGVSGDSLRQFSVRTRSLNLNTTYVNHEYFVAVNGSDSGTGTRQNPFRTLQFAANQVAPGDVVHVLPGVYHQNVEIERGGQPGRYVQFRAEGNVILDGAATSWSKVDQQDDWTFVQDPGIYRVPITWEPGSVYANGQQLFRYDYLYEMTSLRAGAPGGWLFMNNFLYVRLSDGSDPDRQPMQVTQLEYAFYVKNVSHVSIEGFEIQYFGQSVYGKGIYLRNISDCIIRNNKIHQMYCGIWLKGAGSNYNLIEKNTLWENSIYNWPWDDVKGSYHEGAAIAMEAGRGNVIRQNTISGFFNGITVAYWDDLYDSTWNNDTDIHDNYLHHIADDCIEPEGTCINLRIWKNQMHDCTVGISLAPITMGPAYVWRNTIADFTLTSFKFSANTSGPCYLYHNTASTSHSETNGLVSSGPWQNVIFRNNIIEGTVYAIEDRHLNGTANFDYDNLYTTDPNRFVKWDDQRYSSPKELYHATRQEEHALSAASNFVDPQQFNFRLDAKSPNIDRGTVIPNINDEFQGNAPDIGAFEFGANPEAVANQDNPLSPVQFQLLGNYPNPFNNQMVIAYTLYRSAPVRLSIFNAVGQMISRLEDTFKPAGKYEIAWRPSQLSSGAYYYQLQVGTETRRGECLFLK